MHLSFVLFTRSQWLFFPLSRASNQLAMWHQQLIPPHVLIFPLPIQGHVNSMLRLAELLCLAGFHVTFVISHYAHARLHRHANAKSNFTLYPRFSFERISDGLPDDHPRAGMQSLDVVMSLNAIGKPLLRELVSSINCQSSSGTRRPITCVIGDGSFDFAADVADETGIPLIYFRTISAVCFWADFCLHQVAEAGELPLNGSNDYEMDLLVRSVPGMESFLRRRDLPGFCRVDNVSDPVFQTVKSVTRQTNRTTPLILNTFEDLDAPILSQIRTHVPNLYTIGPLHSLLKTKLAAKMMYESTISTSFWEEDRSSMKWLDAQPQKSVIYVSFGSITIITSDQLMEFWYGLVNSGRQFLWVIRPESVAGTESLHQIPTELLESTKERGHIVAWAPQEEVLKHKSVGGFLTHSGWNSTLESIVVGVPMICWPYFADQLINSRFVSEVWKLGLDMKDTCDRVIVEKMIRELMDMKKDEFMQSTNQMEELARQATSEGGSSYHNLASLIEYISSMVM